LFTKIRRRLLLRLPDAMAGKSCKLKGVIRRVSIMERMWVPTTVVAQLVIPTGKVIGVEGNHNLQARYGEDVLSRIAFVCGKGSLDVLQKAVIENINKLIETLAETKGIRLEDITSMAVAGNTTMSHILLG
jgi:uncharacterized 2Fe-2S/4Fe-4S cluster protein (DUF4445 family)